MKTPCLTAILSSVLFCHAASATVVTTSIDEDNGLLGDGAGISLREAVNYSGSGSSITFSAALSGQTIRLALGPLQIFKSLTVDASSLPGGLTLSADRTGNGKTADDTYVLLFGIGNLLLDSLTLTGANCGESAGCIKIYDKAPVALTLDHCTLSGNTAYAYAGINIGSHSANNITLQNTLCAGNQPMNTNDFAFTGTNNLFSGTPRLAPLGNYGGPTQTMPPLLGSPALSGSPTSSADIAASPTDQRCMPRRIDSYHIGAVHYQGSSERAAFGISTSMAMAAPTALRWGLAPIPF